MRFIIIIPTRNRPDTIQHAIRTVTTQNYENYRLIICDNSTNDETQILIEGIKESSIEYYRTNSDLCMSFSWEYALSLVGNDEGYVHIMGDDNGLLPNALNDVSNLLKIQSVNAVISNPCDFIWPNVYDNYGRLHVPVEKNTIKVNSKKALSRSFKMKFGFSRLPNINLGFVHTKVINDVKTAQKGSYFLASAPDVYSALVNCLYCKSYIYSFKPFLINGGSKHSNGVNTQRSELNTNSFIEGNINNGYKYHRAFPPSTSWYLTVYEAYAKLLEVHGDKPWLAIHPKKILSRVIKYEYHYKGRYWLKSDIEYFASNYNLKIPRLIEPLEKLKHVKFENSNKDNERYICSRELNNIYSASVFSGILLKYIGVFSKNPILFLKVYCLGILKRFYFRIILSL